MLYQLSYFKNTQQSSITSKLQSGWYLFLRKLFDNALSFDETNLEKDQDWNYLDEYDGIYVNYNKNVSNIGQLFLTQNQRELIDSSKIEEYIMNYDNADIVGDIVYKSNPGIMVINTYEKIAGPFNSKNELQKFKDENYPDLYISRVVYD